MKLKVTLQLTGNGAFVSTDGRHCDALNPKELLLCAAARCAGLTVLKIMHGEHLRPLRFEITCSGELSTETLRMESVFRSFHLAYDIACASESEQAKVGRAVTLAHEQYCGLVQMLRKIGPVTHEIDVAVTCSEQA